jgi:hypothetical protein
VAAAIRRELTEDVPPAVTHLRIALGATWSWMAPLLDRLATGSLAAGAIAAQITSWHALAQQEVRPPGRLRAAWIEVWSAPDGTVVRWDWCAIDADPVAVFQERAWRPYACHLLCDRALTLGHSGAAFLQEALALPAGLPVLRDPRPKPLLYVPTSDQMPASPSLRRRAYGLAVGRVLAEVAGTAARRILAEVNDPVIMTALQQAWRTARPATERVCFAATTIPPARLARLLATDPRPFLLLATSAQRRDLLDQAADLVLSGPLRFTPARDPLAAKAQRAFLARHPAREGFCDYQLPLALLELIRRLTLPARAQILLDGRLLRRGYADRVRDALGAYATVQELPAPPAPADDWFAALGDALTAHGLPPHQMVAEGDLHHLYGTPAPCAGCRQHSG